MMFDMQGQMATNNLPNEIDSRQSDKSHNAYSQQNTESNNYYFTGIFRTVSRTILHFEFQIRTEHLLQFHF